MAEATETATAISIHSLRVEGDRQRSALHVNAVISIHSLRVEGDAASMIGVKFSVNFNPLPPCGGRQRYTGGLLAAVDFNPLPPCGGRH